MASFPSHLRTFRSDQLWDEFVAEPEFQSEFRILTEAMGRWRQWRADKAENRKARALDQVRMLIIWIL